MADDVGAVAGVGGDDTEDVTVAAVCVVDGWLVSLTGVGCVDPLEPLHDANNISATPAAAIVDLMRMTLTVRTVRRAEAPPWVSGQPEL